MEKPRSRRVVGIDDVSEPFEPLRVLKSFPGQSGQGVVEIKGMVERLPLAEGGDPGKVVVIFDDMVQEGVGFASGVGQEDFLRPGPGRSRLALVSRSIR